MIRRLAIGAAYFAGVIRSTIVTQISNRHWVRQPGFGKWLSGHPSVMDDGPVADDDPAAIREKLAAYREMLAHVDHPDDRRVILSLIRKLEQKLTEIARGTVH
jgi:hypothetical protein